MAIANSGDTDEHLGLPYPTFYEIGYHGNYSLC